jgi:subtilisin family serine protease
MRSFLLPLVALASLPFVAPLHADSSSELVVALAPPRPGAGPALRSARLAARSAALGLAWRGALADGLGLTHAAPRGARVNPFDLDPARVWRIEARDSAGAAAALDSLAGDPDVEWVEPNQRRAAAVVSLESVSEVRPEAAALDPGFPNDPMFRDTRQWALRNAGPGSAYNGVLGADIHALAAWSVTTGSNDVRLAIADTGVDPDHPELQARLPDGSMRVELGMNVTNDPSPSFADSFGHGAGVVGLMAARTNDGAHFESLGVAGVCGGDGHANYGCHIVPIKIAPGHSGDATSFDIARAIVYSADVGARAMNISFAGDGPSRLERLAMYYAITRGCVVVASSGNQGFIPGRKREYPAAYAEDGFAIQVGATDNRDRRAGFSSYGPGLDLVAPGVNNWTTYMTYAGYGGLLRNGYVVGSGTSFSSPHVTGVVGLLAAVRPELTDDDFQHIIRESADDLGAPGPDTLTGWGRLNAARALDAVRPSLGIWHDEVPATVSPAGRTATLTVLESGPGVMDRARLWPDAELYEARATVAFPDSFLDSIRVWPRVGGTMAVRGDFNLRYFAPWAEVVAQDGATFTLRGYLYRQATAQCEPCGDDAYLPLPPDQARFGFTVIGRVDRPPTLHVSSPAAGARLAPGDTVAIGLDARDPDVVSAIEVWLDPEGMPPALVARLPGDATAARLVVPCAAMAGGRAALRVRALDEHGRQHDETSVAVPVTLAPAPCGAAATRVRVAPNPFRGAARIVVPGRGRVDIIDAAGRLVRSVPVEAPATYFDWDGRDDSGRRLGPGLYFARYQGTAGRSLQKLIKLDPEAVGPGRP